MSLIDKFRLIQPQILVEKSDLGTYIDIKQYISKMSVEYGDVSGAGTQANDGCPATASLTVKNDDINNFNPLDRTSTWNQKTSDASYLPFLWNNRNIKIKCGVGTPLLYTETIIGNGSNIYTASRSDIIPFSVTIKQIIGKSPTLATLGTYKWTDLYLGKQLNTYTFNELYAATGTMDICGVSYINGQFNFGKAIPSGIIVEVQYMCASYAGMTLFDGLLGDDISPSEYEVNLTVRDKTKILMDTIIMRDKLRTYNVTGTSSAPIYTDSKTLIDYNDGVPIEIYIANLLEDMLGIGIMPLYAIGSPLYSLKPSNDILQYQTLWNAINGVVSSIGWYIGFRYSDENSGYVLTLMEPPRTKTAVDYALTHTDDFYVATGKLDFSAIRNYITVKYIDADGNVQSQYASDPTSMLNNGIKDLVIETENTKGITRASEALNMAQKILSDLKDAKIYTQIEMPFFPYIEPFDTLSLSYPKLSSTVDFYAVTSVKHEFDFEGNRYRTILNCNAQVTGGVARWQKMATRPGKYEPVTANKLTESYNYAPPTGLNITGTAIVFSDTAVNVQASVSFVKPILDNPTSYELQYKKSTSLWDNATKIITKDTKFNIVLPDSASFDFRVCSIAKNGDRGDFSNILTYEPDSTILKVTDADLGGTRDNTLYIKTQAQFDMWLDNVCNTTAYTPDYSKVIICEGNYTASGRKAINIDKNELSIFGRGNVSLSWEFTFFSTNSIVKTNADFFTFSNIRVTTYNNTLATKSMFEVVRSAPYAGIYNIYNCSIVEGTSINGFILFWESIPSEKLMLVVNDNNFDISGVYLKGVSTGSLLKKLTFQNNVINNRRETSTALYLGYIRDAYVSNNTIINVEATSTKTISVDYVESLKMKDNNINYETQNAPLLRCIEISGNSLGYIISDNVVLFRYNNTGVGYNVNFIQFLSSATCTAFTVKNNVCRNINPNWINIYGGTVTITSGTNTLTIAGATFQTDLKIGQKIKIGTQERVIQTIPSQTQLTVSVNWSANVTGAPCYFEKATITSWLEQNTGSKNNLVINNINDSY